MTDKYVQVAVDSTGKKVGMDQQLDVEGNTVYIQKARLVDAPADVLDKLLEVNTLQLAVLRAILRILSETTNSRAAEDDFVLMNKEL